MALIGQIIRMRATILAYVDLFHLFAITAAPVIPLVLVPVRRVKYLGNTHSDRALIRLIKPRFPPTVFFARY